MRAAVVFVMVLMAGSVWADTQEDAKRFFRAGEQAFNSGQYDVAADAFEQSYKLLSVPAIAFSAAQAHRLQYFIDKEAARLKRSVELFRAYLEGEKSGARRADAAANLAELEPMLAAIEAKGVIEAAVSKRATQLLVSSSVPDSLVRVNGGEARKAPYADKVEAGKFKVQVSAKGYFDFESEVDVFEGQFRVLEVELKAQPAVLRIETESGAEVRVDGRAVGTAPATSSVEVPAGTHLIAVLRNGRRAWSREVVVERGQKLTVRAPLRRSGQRLVSHVVLGTAGVALLTSGAFAVGALVADSDASDILGGRSTSAISTEELARYLDRRDDRNRRRTGALVFAGVGAAAAGAWALLYYMDKPSSEERPPSSTVVVVPHLGSGSGGVALSGRF